ncbi:Uncharacterized protein DAT39_016103 [Clarias magur]|uniref:Uncharacterized protein n=1 Tax=Clarias magur TaxID=1594786 RepID=A0A8J4WX76_CLAMG|nr:Uncharacterized protein DAT39_016103 [Clarias magur]
MAAHGKNGILGQSGYCVYTYTSNPSENSHSLHQRRASNVSATPESRTWLIGAQTLDTVFG